MSATINRLEGQAKDQLSGIQDKIESVSDRVKPAINEAWRKTDEAINQISDTASTVTSEARKGLNDAADMVARQPIASLLIAGAAGFILARLLSR